MRDYRQNNGKQHNNHLYKIFGIRDDNYTWDKPADYYVSAVILCGTYMAGNTKFDITNYRQKHSRQHGIVIIDENIREVFGRMKLDCYVLKGVMNYSINQAVIHSCFNDTAK